MLPITGKNAKTIARGGGSQCRLRVRAKVTQNPSSYKLPFKKGRPCPEPPTTGVQKSLVSSISCMTCELSDYTARGFWASDVQRCSKSPALIPEKREYQGAGDPWHYNQNNLKSSSNTTEGYTAATQRLKKAVEWKWLKLDRWFC